MHRTTDKYMVIILLLSMVFAPLQFAVADVVGFSGNLQPTQQAMDIPMDHAGLMGSQMSHNCKQCHQNYCCDGSVCLSAQCTGCLPAVVLTFLPAVDNLILPLFPFAQNGYVNRSIFVLYRPPRV